MIAYGMAIAYVAIAYCYFLCIAIAYCYGLWFRVRFDCLWPLLLRLPIAIAIAIAMSFAIAIAIVKG